jgi:translation initiation factor IF-2
MDKVKIQEIADEAGLSNADLLDKAKELGFDVKAANSTISMENAGILVVKKKVEAVVEEKVSEEVAEEITESVPSEEVVTEETVAEEVIAEEVAAEKVTESTEAVSETTVETVTEETVVEEKPIVKEVKKRKGISVVSKKTEPEIVPASTGEGEEKPKRRVLSRTGIKIVRKAKPAPVRAGTRISMGDQTPYVAKKKPKKGPAEARDSGKKIDIFNHDSMRGDIDSGFGDEEVVLLDFSDKNIYEEMMRQEQKRKEEANKWWACKR